MSGVRWEHLELFTCSLDPDPSPSLLPFGRLFRNPCWSKGLFPAPEVWGDAFPVPTPPSWAHREVLGLQLDHMAETERSLGSRQSWEEAQR